MEENVIIAYKGFDKNLCCRGFQYEIGKEYVQEGEIECCGSGFHACTNPFDVLDYYPFDSRNRFCVVEQSGTIKTANDSTKQASSKIKIKAEIGMAGLFKAGVEWIKEKTNPVPIIAETKDKNDNPSGDYAKIGSSGDSAQIGSSGNSAQIYSTGKDAVIMCAGSEAKAKAKIGSWITLAEWRYDGTKECYVPVCVKTEYVDGKKIKPDTLYQLIDGEFKEI